MLQRHGAGGPEPSVPPPCLGPPTPFPPMRMNGAACVPCRIYPGSAGTTELLYIGNVALL